MSPVSRTLRYLTVGCALLAVLVAGCSKKRGTPFDPDEGHPDDFFAKHSASFRSDSGSCTKCHGKNLDGGISKVSCYSASRGDQGCHSGGPGGHDAGWAASGSHGAVAKGVPGPASGFAWCKECHGADFKGGSAGTGCFGCHGVNAPHPKGSWRGSLTHTNTVAENASVCADCHRSRDGDPGCFNNTLCHGEVVDHPEGWDSPAQHGAAAKGAPGNMSGFAACQVCHGGGFTGGSSGESCFPCHGWDAPHGRNGWDGGGTSHRSTDQGNASVCADCHRSNSGTAGCFNNTLCHGASAGHPDGWAAGNQHGATAKAAPGSSSGMLYCEECHGSDFSGGSSGQSCLVSGCHGWNAPHARTGWDGGAASHRSTSEGNADVCAQCHRSNSGTAGCFNNTLCHAGTPGGTHPSGWSAGNQHGATAKAAPGSASGMLYCEGCHGSGLNGGSSNQSCLVSGCHGWQAPHARTGWDGGGSSHRSTNEGNANVCAQCHRSASGTAGCFNNTLCHAGTAGGTHPTGWSAGNQHGATAKAAPGGSSGMLYCEGCHGSGLNGGSSGQSCLINSGCHGWSAPHARNGWDAGGTSHRSTNEGNANVCGQCHQSAAGTPGCFNNTLCHGATATHPAGWADRDAHGATAKAAPGTSSGLSYCTGCHGSGYTGGTSGQSCFPCHGWNAPHGLNGWTGGGSRHRNTNEGNANACALCHRSATGTAGCFNNTLCHGN